MVPFGGWQMPVQYSNILKEHHNVRHAAGLFDISHMGELWVSGPGAADYLDYCLSNQASSLALGEGHYTLLLNREGGILDDLLCYRTRTDRFLLVVNASKIEADAQWMRSLCPQEAFLENLSDAWCGLALQGPSSSSILKKALGDHFIAPARNRMVSWTLRHERDERDESTLSWIARTGYTGEDGFEVFCPVEQAQAWWDLLLGAGQEHALTPCGLGCRDTLRLEMGYPLNGSDLSPAKTALEAGLGSFVKFTKSDFVGKQALLEQKQRGIPTRLTALEMPMGAPPPRSGYPVWHSGEAVGNTTSGTLSPSLGHGIALAYLPSALNAIGTEVEIEIRGKRYPARVCKRPFFKHPLTAAL